VGIGSVSETRDKLLSDKEIASLDLTNVRDLRTLLFAHQMRPNKSFGQNFLINRGILEQIVAAAELQKDEQVLEVGAGTGVLTRELALHAEKVVAVELERDMLALLRRTTAHLPNVELVAQNMLFLNPDHSFEGKPYKLVANLPYYLTAAAFRHFLQDVTHKPRRLVVMVQLEVAQRAVAEPGDLSLLGVSIQFFGKPRIITRVPAQAFYPAPKVDSAVLQVDVYDEVPLAPEEQKRFFKLVQAGFSEKRKQIHNALARGLHLKNEEVRGWLAAAHIDPMRRAETLSIDEWLQLWRVTEAGSPTVGTDMLS